MQIINELWARLRDEPKREEEAFLLLNFIRYAFFFFGKFSLKLNSASQRNIHLVCASLIFFHRNVAEARFSYNKRIKGKATHDLITIFMFFEVKNDQLNSIFLKTNGSPKWRKKRESDSKSWNQASITSLGSRQGSHIMLIPKSPPLSPY